MGWAYATESADKVRPRLWSESRRVVPTGHEPVRCVRAAAIGAEPPHQRQWREASARKST